VRSVSDKPSDAAAAEAAVTPGTTATEIPAASSASISSLARPNTMGSPPFSRTTCLPSPASDTISAQISSCVQDGFKAAFADGNLLGFAAGEIEHFNRDEIVVKNHIG
jgi:large exoprotein involved in heme utilization and adhesion